MNVYSARVGDKWAYKFVHKGTAIKEVNRPTMAHNLQNVRHPDHQKANQRNMFSSWLSSMESELGAKIHENICTSCWSEWMAMSIKVINEFRLNLATPEANEIYDQQMREFLGV